MKSYSMYMLKTDYFHVVRGVLFSDCREMDKCETLLP